MWFSIHRPEVEIVSIDRTLFAQKEKFASHLMEVVAVIHCAAAIRGSDSEVEEINCNLAHGLIEALAEVAQSKGGCPRVIYANSTHYVRDTAYGRGKAKAGDILRRGIDAMGGELIDVVLPNLFGEFGKPHYNSVVSTFCYQVMMGEKPSIHKDSEVELVYAQNAAESLASVAGAEDGIGVSGTVVKVSDLLDRITEMGRCYLDWQTIPAYDDPFDVSLFNTFRSYAFPAKNKIAFPVHTDVRGKLFEAVKTGAGGQVFFSSTYPGYTRGNHFHAKKFERFVVVEGEGIVRLRRVFTPDVVEIFVSGADPAAVDIPPFCAHNLTNSGERDLLAMFWSNQIYDPACSDTYSFCV